MGSLAIKLVPILSLLAWSAPASQQKQEQHGDNIQGPAAILGLAKIEKHGIATEKFPSPLMTIHSGSEGKRRTRSVSKATDGFYQPDFIFDLPDVVTSYRSETRQIQIEAFPARGNSAILDSKAPTSLQSRLYWVSIGHPRFVKTLGISDDHEGDEEGTAAPEKNQLFHFTHEGIHTYIEMLTQTQQKLLAEQASRKYGLDIQTSQIAHLSLSQFTCSLSLTDSNGDKHMLKGEVADFRSYPLRMDFEAHADSKERQLFETRLMGKGNSGKRGNFKFQCHMATAGKLVKVNTLQVTREQFQKMGLIEELFGPADWKYVTRHQLNSLATRMYSHLNISEEYDMPEQQFTKAFQQELLDQSIVTQLSDVPFPEALGHLSAFSSPFGKYLPPEEVVKEYGSRYAVVKVGGKSRIIAVQDRLNSLKFLDEDDPKGNANLGVPGLLGIGTSVKVVETDEESKTIFDQLKELNGVTQDGIKWAIESSRVIPGSLNVAHLSRSSFEKTILFRTIRRESWQAAFNRTTALYTVDNLESSDSAFTEMQAKIQGIENSLLTMTKWKDEQTPLLHTSMKNFKSSQSALTEMQVKIQGIENSLSTMAKWKEELQELKEKASKMASQPLQLDTSPFTDTNLWELGFQSNWEALKRILKPVVNEEFAVINATTQLFLDGVRKRFDSSTDSTVGNYIINNLVLVASSDTSSSSEAILKMLVSAGIDPDVPTKQGFRPSHTCGQEGTVELARIIFPCRPDMKAKNVNGHTPLEAARTSYNIDKDRPNIAARRPLVAKVIEETTSNGTAENGFPSIAELASKEMFFAVKNLIRRRVVLEAEFKETFNGKTADEWAAHFKLPMLQKEILYYKAERPGSIEELRLQLEQIRKKLDKNKE